MKNLYLVVLQGQGDTTASLHTKEVFDWIVSEETNGRVGDERSWYDPDAPEGIDGKVWVSIGSYDNDRALYACEIDIKTTYDLKSMMVYIRENNVVVMDTYEGSIY